MIKANKSKRTLLRLLAAALVLVCLPCGALAESFSAAVKSKSMKVYADAYGNTYLGSLSKKTIVTVEEYSGGVAKISYKGVTGYAKVSDLLAVESFAKKATANRDTYAFQKADINSASVKVKSGTSMYVLAVKENIAMVERGGNVGYVYAAHLTIEGQTAAGSTGSSESASGNSELSQSQLEALKKALEAQAAKESESSSTSSSGSTSSGSTVTLEQAFTSGKYSNEQLCFAFAVKVLGYNKAAAVGLLANISAESGFRTTINGDSGKSYGICQWYSNRKTRLLNWCENKGVDASSLAAQLYFLKYELETYYPSVNKYMKSVEDSAQGAYDAAYYFCYNFEAPANKASKSASRGNSAKNIFYPRYENSSI